METPRFKCETHLIINSRFVEIVPEMRRCQFFRDHKVLTQGSARLQMSDKVLTSKNNIIQSLHQNRNCTGWASHSIQIIIHRTTKITVGIK